MDFLHILRLPNYPLEWLMWEATLLLFLGYRNQQHGSGFPLKTSLRYWANRCRHKLSVWVINLRSYNFLSLKAYVRGGNQSYQFWFAQDPSCIIIWIDELTRNNHNSWISRWFLAGLHAKWQDHTISIICSTCIFDRSATCRNQKFAS